MAHPEILGFVVPREEGGPHALIVRYVGAFHVGLPSRAITNEPLHCNKRPNRESQDEADEQEDRHEAERQVLPHPAPASEGGALPAFGLMRRKATSERTASTQPRSEWCHQAEAQPGLWPHRQ
jgi:hypothetical protein